MMNDIAKMIKKDWLVLLMLVASTAFFVYQHSRVVAWDFMVFSLNARNLFSEGYFEWERAPLTTVLMLVFQPLGYETAEYAYIALTSFLFFISVKSFAKKFKLNLEVLYALLLTPFLLSEGLLQGTELLSLTWLILFITHIPKKRSAVFLGLACLTRYTNYIFFLIYLIRVFPSKLTKKEFSCFVKRVIVYAGVIIACFSPWLLLNYVVLGDPLASMFNSFVFNVLFRQYIKQSLTIEHVLRVMTYLLPIALIGVFVCLKEFKKVHSIETTLLFFAVITLVSFFRIPIKVPRYLFNLTLPLAFFSTRLVEKLKHKRIVIIAVLMINFYLAGRETFLVQELPEQALKKAGEVLSRDCMLLSNAWIHLGYHYYPKPVSPYPYAQLVKKRLDEGYDILMFKRIKEPSWHLNQSFLNELPIAHDDDEIIYLRNESVCAPLHYSRSTYLQKLNTTMFELTGSEVHYTLLDLLLGKRQATDV